MKRSFLAFYGIPLVTSGLFLCGIQGGTIEAQTYADKKPVVLVAPFENLSEVRAMISYEVATGSDPDRPKRYFRVDRYSEAPRHILEDILLSFGAQVVERQRLDALLLETEFGRLSGLVDPEKAIRLGRMLGAGTIVMGTITDVRSQQSKFSGYGIRTANIEVIGSVRIRLVDVGSGSVRFSKTVQGSSTFMSSNFGGTSNSDVAYTVIEAALNKLRDDKSFREAIVPPSDGPASQEGSVKFAPVPEKCDIEVDGIYRGSSPLVVALPRGRTVRVKISKAGYKTWEATIAPTQGLLVNPVLEKIE